MADHMGTHQTTQINMAYIVAYRIALNISANWLIIRSYVLGQLSLYIEHKSR